jgi:hypothetical protein
VKTEQTHWIQGKGWGSDAPGMLGSRAQLVLVFGSSGALHEREPLQEIRRAYPGAHLLGCSTAGEISDTQVLDDSLVTTAIQFEGTTIQGTQIKLGGSRDSFAAGAQLGEQLGKEGLAHVFVLSDGLSVNGSELVAGLTQHLPPHVAITGGLAGDGAKFQETLVLWDDEPEQDVIVALGLYGDRIRVGYGSLGGWDSFGPERLISRSRGNVLYELDGKSALQLYKTYLGEHAQGLPATALLFPLSVRTEESVTAVVRTILSIDENEQSMTFAGDLSEGAYARFMKANFDRLIDGATSAARTSSEAIGSASPDLAILISCVGRKLVLKQRIEEEVESVREVLGERPVLAGFYSYGEISPFTAGAKCELHNQTMTITTFSEQ